MYQELFSKLARFSPPIIGRASGPTFTCPILTVFFIFQILINFTPNNYIHFHFPLTLCPHGNISCGGSLSDDVARFP